MKLTSLKLFSTLIVIAGFGSLSTKAAEDTTKLLHLKVTILSHASLTFPVKIKLPRRTPPFTLALISHGLSSDPAVRARTKLPRYDRLEDYLLRRGYAVAIYRRPGYGPVRQPFLEDYGDCANPDYTKSADAIASTIAWTLKAIRKRIKLRRQILLIGHSAGAMGTLAFAAKYPGTVRATINFSGGFGGRAYGQPDNNCATGKLIRLAHDLGRLNKAPSLWLYAQNDSYFMPHISRAMASKYKAGGAKLEFHLLRPITQVGHGIIVSNRAAKIWSPILDNFLARHN